MEQRRRGGPKDLPAAQQLLHEAFSPTVISDYYSRPPSYGQVVTPAFRAPLQEQDWDRLLDHFTARLGLRWERHQGALLFRHRIWWIEDEAEVPPQLVRRLAEGRRTRGHLDLDELSAVAILTDRQHLTLLHDYLPPEPVSAAKILRPWGQLRQSISPSQRRHLSSPGGLAISEAPPDEVRRLFERDRFLQPQIQALPDEELRRSRVRFSLEPEALSRYNQPAAIIWAGLVLPNGQFIGHRLEQPLEGK